jgi:hypothetical protein
MLRKTKESPLNLIRILPPKEGASPYHRYDPASAHFKLKLDGEETGSVLSFGGLVGVFNTIFRGLDKIGPWMLHQVQSVINWFSQGFVQFGQWAKFLGGGLRKPARKLKVEIQASGKQLWNDMTPATKPPVNETVIKERSKQREMLIEEVHAIRSQLTSHQDELIRVTAQMEELKALVSSQQQVLLHLGKELEATERNQRLSERPTIRKADPPRSKPSNPNRSSSSESKRPTQFEFRPPHH